MRLNRRYSVAKMAFDAIAYCDQNDKIIAVYDNSDILRIVIKQRKNNTTRLLFIGDDKTKSFKVNEPILTDATEDNRQACQDIYYSFIKSDIPTIKLHGTTEVTIKIVGILTHSKYSMYRHGDFRIVPKSERVVKKISQAKEALRKQSKIARKTLA